MTMKDVFVRYETRPEIFRDQIIGAGPRHNLPLRSFNSS